MEKAQFNEGLLGFLDACKTPFHTVENMAMMLENAGFVRLYEELEWKLEFGRGYYVVREGKALVAFTYTSKNNYTIVTAHTDSPSLMVKPQSVVTSSGVTQLGVEPYGGALLNSWFDRDLALGGRVYYLSKENIIQHALVDIKEAIATIPSLAIHLDANANKDKTINKQNHLAPIIQMGKEFVFEEFLAKLLHQSGVEFETIYSHELLFYDIQKSSFLGVNKEFISGSKLDNLLSCYAALLAICSISKEVPYMLVALDHEEVGSESTSGAEGNFAEAVYKRIYPDYGRYIQSTRSSFIVSCDNAHAVHPNFADKHEKNHQVELNKGVVIKYNANKRYATSAKTAARYKNVASSLGYKTQEYVVRSDMGCGSTIAPMLSAKLGVEAVDVGVATLAMHSIRELCGSDDLFELYNTLVGFSNL